MQATKLHTRDAVMQLHPRGGTCCGILRERRGHSQHQLTHHHFNQGEERKELQYTHSVI